MEAFRIESIENRHPPEIVDRFRAISTSIIADAMGRFHTMNGIRHYNEPGTRMVGVALTVRTICGDNLMIHKAIDMAQRGDVVVVEGGGVTSRALLGEIMCKIGQKKGIAGYVVDGAVRDAEAIRQSGFPVFAKGLNPAGPFKEGPGQINVAINCAGATVQPGDIVVGDDDGVVIVPHELVLDVLQQVSRIIAYEERMLEQIEAGTIDRGWVDQTLLAKGCRIRA